MAEPSAKGNPYRPIAVGFALLSLPLLIAALFLAEEAGGRWTNGAAAAVMLGCAASLGWRTR